MIRRIAPRPWEEAYRLQGRLWRGVRLDPATARLLEARPGLRDVPWLDAGCGDGKGLVPLSGIVSVPPIGVDASRQGLRLAASALGEAEREARLVEGDVRALPFRDGTFGAVRAVHILGHLLAADRVAAAQALARVLARGGLLVAVEFAVGDFRAGAGEEVEPGTHRRGHGVLTHYFGAGELEGLFRAAGLEVLSSEEERFTVHYGGVPRDRSRIVVLAARSGESVG